MQPTDPQNTHNQDGITRPNSSGRAEGIDERGGKSGQTSHPVEDELEPLNLTHQDYLVGWICALPKEQTAATAMLDTVHPSLPKSLHDHNTYTLGRIGKHNVVIACLPKGRYATIPTATCATWMMGTFPSIRFGLMVGIGAGIPGKVKLGDVVVSTPVAEYPGVIKWDLGKAEEDGHFKRTGSLNNPPTALLTALARLETQHEMHGSKMRQCLDEMGDRWPRLRSKYTSPALLEDPLSKTVDAFSALGHWQTKCIMIWNTVIAAVLYLLGHFALKIVNQQNRSSDSHASVTDIKMSREMYSEPQVHYGLIASGDQVVKDAKFRDLLNQRLGGNVLCIEMEAAGLMNDFPCIVIRGICDYADKHKTKEWQEYAAAVAAACAKELLEVADHGEIKHAPAARLVTQMR